MTRQATPIIDMSKYLAVAEMVGNQRQAENERAGRLDLKSRVSDDSGALHRLGAIGEMAFALWSESVWTGLFSEGEAFERFRQQGAPDVGDDVQVRTSGSLSHNLIIYPKDQPTHRFVLVLIESRLAHICGWIYGMEAQHLEFWGAHLPRPNYVFPRDRLRPMSSWFEKVVASSSSSS